MRQAVEQERQQRREALQQVGRGSATGFAGGARYHDSNFALAANMRLFFFNTFPRTLSRSRNPSRERTPGDVSLTTLPHFFDKYGF